MLYVEQKARIAGITLGGLKSTNSPKTEEPMEDKK